MSWKSIINRAEKILGGPPPFVDIKALGKAETATLTRRVRALANSSSHPFVRVFHAHAESSPNGVFSFLKSPRFISSPQPSSLAEGLVIPMIGQLPASKTDNRTNILSQRKMSEIYEMVKLAVSLHRSIIEISKTADEDELKATYSGNKLATLSGDILLASASLELASYQIPKIVEIISGAIADTISAEFSDFAATPSSEFKETELLSKWINHITLRNGALLGACCEASILLQGASSVDSSVLEDARRFGVAWGCLNRLYKERRFAARLPSSGHSDVEFTQGGIPEPSLVVACAKLSKKYSVEALLSSAAQQFGSDLRQTSDRLTSHGTINPDIGHLVTDSTTALLRDIL